MPGTVYIPRSGNQDIDGILYGTGWAVNSFTFSLPSSGSFYGYTPEPQNGFAAFEPQDLLAVSQILEMYEDVANLSFAQVTESAAVHGDLRYAFTSSSTVPYWGGMTYYPSSLESGGDVWLGMGNPYPERGNSTWFTLLHETGHAMGLDHGHATDHYGSLPAEHDSWEYSVMTYSSYAGADGSSVHEGNHPQTLMLSDIAALQHMYGANFGSRSGDTVYSWSPSTGEAFVDGIGQGQPQLNAVFETVWDGGGIDTYDLAAYMAPLDIDLAPGGWSTISRGQLAQLSYDGEHPARGNIANAFLYNGDERSLIENVIGGSGADVLRGNHAGNTLWGGDGKDVIYGEGGNDIIYGGSATSQSGISFGDGQIDLGRGTQANVSSEFSLAFDPDFVDSTSIPHEVVTGTGSGLSIYLYLDIENVGAEVWFNLQDPSGTYELGIFLADEDDDTLTNGNNREYVFTEVGQFKFSLYKVIGNSYSPISDGIGYEFSISLDGEYIDQEQELFGGAGDDYIGGGADGDTLDGGTGNDVLFGGAGGDSYDLGDGHDMVWLDTGDTLVDAGGGNDTVFIVNAAGVTLDVGATHVETVFGGAGADVLNGATATWALTLSGAAGADTLTGGSLGDHLTGGADADTLTGNGGNDRLYGDAGDDHLWGGAGNDSLYGGAGADIFHFATGFGADTIFDWGFGADKVHFTGIANLDTWSEVSAHTAQVGAAVVISDGAGNSLTLAHTTLASLDAGDFLF